MMERKTGERSSRLGSGLPPTEVTSSCLVICSEKDFVNVFFLHLLYISFLPPPPPPPVRQHGPPGQGAWYSDTGVGRAGKGHQNHHPVSQLQGPHVQHTSEARAGGILSTTQVSLRAGRQTQVPRGPIFYSPRQVQVCRLPG